MAGATFAEQDATAAVYVPYTTAAGLWDLATEDIAERQARADKEHARRVREASLDALTLRTGLRDMAMVLRFQGRTLADMFVVNDKLRGLGLWCIAFGVLGIVAT